jgi:hypothetical protein
MQVNQQSINYGIAALIGAVLAVIVGFMVYAIDGQGVTFSYWIIHPIRYGAFGWVFIGGLVGAGIRYLTAA